jgi:hypothetical protein
LSILALEPHRSKAAMLRRIVADACGAKLAIVESRQALLAALDQYVPELILLPALMPPADEWELLQHIRSLRDTRHLEVLITPHPLASPIEMPSKSVPAWRQWFSRPPSRTNSVPDREPHAFAARLVWSLERANEARHPQNTFEGELSAEDRRAYRRFCAQAFHWLQTVRIKNGPQVKVLDLSAGGVLLETDARLQTEREMDLELITDWNQWVFPFRVVRRRLGDGLLYKTGCAFTQPFDIDEVLRAGTASRKLLTGGVLRDGREPEIGKELNPPSFDIDSVSLVRQPASRQERDERRKANDVPWLSNVRLPWGLEVDLLNISRTGMLVETNAKFTPGAETEFHLLGPDTSLAVPARFVRNEISEVSPLGVKYRAAATFAKELNFPDAPQRTEAPRALADLLNQVLRDPNRGSDQARLRTTFCQRLRTLVPAREIAINDAPVKPGEGAEAIYFTVPGAAGSSAVLQANFESDHPLNEVEFKLLRGAAALAAVVLEFERQ